MAEFLASQVSAEDQHKVRRFFEVYDPQRLESSDFNVLLRYIANRGMPALEAKLLKKYGVNISSMQQDTLRASRRLAPPVGINFNNNGNVGGMSNQNQMNQSNDQNSDLPKLERSLNSKRELEFDELDNLPPPPLDEDLEAEKQELFKKSSNDKGKQNDGNGFVRDRLESVHKVAGISPDSGDPDAIARADLFHRLTEFYKAYNIEKLNKGIGDVVEYALVKGEEKINKKLQETYGADLNTFEEKIRQQRKETATLNRTEFQKEEAMMKKNANPKRKELRDKLVQFFGIVDPQRAQLKMDPLLNYAEKFGDAQLNKKLYDKYGKSLDVLENPGISNVLVEPNVAKAKEELQNLMQKSINPVSSTNSKQNPPSQEKENQNIFPPLSSLQNQVQNQNQPVRPKNRPQGLQKLMNNGSNMLNRMSKGIISTSVADDFLEKAPSNSAGTHDLPEYVKLMLERFYARYDQRMLESGGVDAVYDWAVRNGLNKLNKQLFDKYNQSLQGFIEAANEMRDDLIDFYRQFDRNKLVMGIQPILDWGLRNGRKALNTKLKAKYGMDLDFDIDQEVMESASQV